ncbi:hypothetical protein GGTG_00798 [Gaeumannomyces tritici R3-111a-1]|uniref:Uncharacterized protein n=1 Tax=Gaeumannomyces tritici (strain R3-111a-1) TaxID=644352 RepID=J3NHR1_GAET3|nr:hypothetical protein GGTG_00798 [Gaeumannomyces tritici R3-111a-1]EJT80804.1 hypothetical protein GGTG_00798 [Gaeumannomyces tritici R3-111a-1]
MQNPNGPARATAAATFPSMPLPSIGGRCKAAAACYSNARAHPRPPHRIVAQPVLIQWAALARDEGLDHRRYAICMYEEDMPT